MIPRPDAPPDAGENAVTVRPVRSRDDREAFIRLPWRVYRGDPNWVPPLLKDMRDRLDPEKHPFHRHSDVELFLALRDGSRGRPAGRIAAIHNRRHVEYHGEPVGFFGFFECEEDPAVARGLLDAAGGWLERRGLEVMRGPTNFSTNEESGLLVEGFDRPPVVMMTYNPPYYAELLRQEGFRGARTLVAYYLDDNRPPEYLLRASKLVRRRYPEVTIRPLRMDAFDEELERVRAIYNAAWQDNWGFVPMTDAELEHMASELRPVLNPELALIAEDGEGRPIAFSLTLPDFNEALRHANGRLFPFGLLRILWHARSIHRARVVTLGIVEEYRGRGIDALLYLETFRRGAAEGIEEAEFSWVLEDNELMRRPLERMGAGIYKRYRLYDRPL